MPQVFFTYSIYESDANANGYTLYDEGDIELETVPEAKAEVEHHLPDRIYSRNWLPGDNECHCIIQQDSLIQAIVILKPANLDPNEPIRNTLNTDYFQTGVLKNTTQTEIAKKINTTQQRVSQWLQQSDQIKVENLMKICDAVNIDIRLLFNPGKDLPPS